MAKLPECDHCVNYAKSPFLVCAIHPSGAREAPCPDFCPTPASAYLKEPIKEIFRQRYSEVYARVEKINALPFDLRLRVLQFGVQWKQVKWV
jgi:hypothetical protein